MNTSATWPSFAIPMGASRAGRLSQRAGGVCLLFVFVGSPKTTRLNKPDPSARLRVVMKNQHSTKTAHRTKLGAQIPVPLAFVALFLIGFVPRTALGQGLLINQPDVYIVAEPIAPPPVRFEVRPPIPYAGAIWVSGYWWWNGASHVWISGHHVRPIRGYRFVAPRWVFSGGYHYHIRGHYRPYGATVRHRPYHHYRHGHGASDRGHGDHDRSRSVHHRRTAARQRSVRSSHASSVHRGRGAGSSASRGGGTHRGAGTARTRQ